MGLRIATNSAAIAGRRHLSGTNDALSASYQRLSSGNRITKAADDAAGLSISEKLRSEIRSVRQAERNANDGISFVQVAEGGLNEVSNILVRLRELSVQAASDTIGDKERGFINQEYQSLIKEVDRIADVTTFNGTPLLNGKSDKGVLEFQVGTRNNEADRIGFDVSENTYKADAIGIDGANTESIEAAREAMDQIDGALVKVNEGRARFGAMQSKLQSTVNNLQVAHENYSAARSRIVDTDLAEETTNLVSKNILQSAGISMLAQANNAPMAALKLL